MTSKLLYMAKTHACQHYAPCSTSLDFTGSQVSHGGHTVGVEAEMANSS